jgi:transcription elongation GreA/GreB family factor
MSRAFVRESDQSEPLPERKVSAHPNFVTPAGLAQIESQVRDLEASREALQAGADDAELARISRDLRYWKDRKATARVIEAADHPEVVRFGVRVTLHLADGRQQAFRLVGEDEADPPRGLVSWVSPLGAALIGRREGDTVNALGMSAEIVRLES